MLKKPPVTYKGYTHSEQEPMGAGAMFLIILFTGGLGIFFILGSSLGEKTKNDKNMRALALMSDEEKTELRQAIEISKLPDKEVPSTWTPIIALVLVLVILKIILMISA